MKHTVEEITLSTGTKGLLINVPESEVVQVKLFFRAGYQFGDFMKFEVPHVLEHLILSSSKSYPGKNQLRAEFTKNGAQYNASTSKDLLVYWLQAADIDFERAFKLFAKGIIEPILPEDSLQAEIGNVRSELSAKMAQNSLKPGLMSLPANFPKHYIPLQDRIDQLEQITIADVEGYFEESHTAANSEFMVAGAAERFRDVVIKELEALYGKLPVGSRKVFNQDPGIGQGEPLVSSDESSAEFFRLDWFEEGGNQLEAAAYEILSTVLSRGWDSRIFGRLRNTGASYGTYTGYDHSLAATHVVAYGQANPDKLDEIYTVIAEECTRLMSEGFSEKELDKAVMRIEGGAKVSIQMPSTLSGWYQEEYIFNQNIQSQEEFFAQLRGVTSEDVARAARKIFSSTKHSSAYAGPLTKTQIAKSEKLLAPIWK